LVTLVTKLRWNQRKYIFSSSPKWRIKIVHKQTYSVMTCVKSFYSNNPNWNVKLQIDRGQITLKPAKMNSFHIRRNCLEREDQQHVDRGSMQMAQHHVIYSRKKRKQWFHSLRLRSHSFNASTIKWLLTLFAANPSPCRPNGLVFFSFLYVVPAFARLQLLIFPPLRWARPSPTPSL
jgi:hypothetical protein